MSLSVVDFRKPEGDCVLLPHLSLKFLSLVREGVPLSEPYRDVAFFPRDERLYFSATIVEE